MKFLLLFIAGILVAGCARNQKFLESTAKNSCADAVKALNLPMHPEINASTFGSMKRVEPRFPRSAIHDETPGCVAILTDVTADGKLTNIRIVHEDPANEGFGTEALRAFKKWEFPKKELKDWPTIIRFNPTPKPKN